MRLIERDEEELGNLGLGREEDMFLVAEKVDDGVVCIEGWKGGIKGSPRVAGIMPERESVADCWPRWRRGGGGIKSVNRR